MLHIFAWQVRCVLCKSNNNSVQRLTTHFIWNGFFPKFLSGFPSAGIPPKSVWLTGHCRRKYCHFPVNFSIFHRFPECPDTPWLFIMFCRNHFSFNNEISTLNNFFAFMIESRFVCLRLVGLDGYVKCHGDFDEIRLLESFTMVDWSFGVAVSLSFEWEFWLWTNFGPRGEIWLETVGVQEWSMTPTAMLELTDAKPLRMIGVVKNEIE